MEMLHEIGIGGDQFIFIHRVQLLKNGALDLSYSGVF
jgi:hypothetical protein